MQKAIAPTQLGEAVCEYMEKNFPDIMDLNFTARLEGALDKVADGKQQWQELIGAFYPRLMKFVERAAKQGGGSYMPDEESDVICDKCGAKWSCATANTVRSWLAPTIQSARTSRKSSKLSENVPSAAVT